MRGTGMPLPRREASMKKLDLRKQLKHLYNPPAGEPVLIDVPAMTFACIDGRGDPNGPEFAAATGALYAFSYTIKFMVKKQRAIDYPVMALEGLWAIEGKTTFSLGDYHRREAWLWTLMIMQPDVAASDLWPSALEQAARRGTAGLEKLHFERFEEGRCAQVMHIGPYSAEPATVDRLHAFIGSQGLQPRGRHHEIYLGDPRRSAPEKLKTVLRHPVEPAAR
jgi:hypothetical protein